MALPHASCAADIPADVCCDSFWLIGERIRTVACAGLVACMDEDCADREFRSYQTIGPVVQDPHGETLIVSFVRSYIRSDTQGRQRGTEMRFVTMAEYKVQLLENGWPTISRDSQTGTIVSFDWEKVHGLAKHATGHAEKMWRSLVNASVTTNQANALFPVASNPHIVQKSVIVSELTPMPRPGPQVGWEMNVTVGTSLP